MLMSNVDNVVVSAVKSSTEVNHTIFRRRRRRKKKSYVYVELFLKCFRKPRDTFLFLKPNMYGTL